MTRYKQLLQAATRIFLLSAVFSMPAHADLPDTTYACHVQTKGSGPGLVRVQAHSLESARQIALRAEALNRYGTYTPVKRLIQCIKTPGGRFSDPDFQELYKNLPG